jgi:hypothetical protein
METVNFRLISGKQKCFNSALLSTGTGIFKKYWFTINLKNWTSRPPTIKQQQNKLFFINLKKLDSLIYNNLNKDLGDNILIDSMWLDS